MRTAAEIAIRAAKGYGEDGCAVFAGGVTYFALLSLFPLTLFALSITGFIFTSDEDQARLVDNMIDTLPIDEGSGRDDLESLMRSVVESRGTLGIIGLVGAAYSASALFGAVRTSLNAVVGAKQKRPFFVGKAVDLALVLLFTALLLLSVAVTFGIAFAQRFSEELFGEEAATWTARLLNVAYALVPTAVSALVFFLLFTLVPARRLGVRNTIWGASVAAMLFEVLKILFAIYVTNFGNYNATYGTLGFVIILLVFFNFSAQIMLLGAEVARAGADVAASTDRFASSNAALAKVHKIAGRVPFAVRLLPSLVAPVETAEVAPAPVEDPQPGPLPGPVAVQPRLQPSAERTRRPVSGALILLMGGAVAGIVAFVRRR